MLEVSMVVIYKVVEKIGEEDITTTVDVETMEAGIIVVGAKEVKTSGVFKDFASIGPSRSLLYFHSEKLGWLIVCKITWSKIFEL